ncbi:hypothetical protein PN478_07650 [Dolichospermum circinale CS-534/05]|uniref:hypothetical protein n=1 Tax=Dolichospermum circinale TaxID=109265 RepID=UPI000487F81E|nr:hypothetical protein [Dolichospermum circinale]MDB9478316.1 hypothetical protein [Dolichospermum circinale CS-537/03]MDB9490391.1 hypothetical protein [Dolichospermum circinale CS-534/05]MDB9546341.1 hypothetical protein [Dolichospermum circinale CS-1031]
MQEVTDKMQKAMFKMQEIKNISCKLMDKMEEVKDKMQKAMYRTAERYDCYLFFFLLTPGF